MGDRSRALVARMTLEEKASLCSGADQWYLKAVPRLGMPSIMVTDGPHGLRKTADSCDNAGIAHNLPATCFPTASALASSWDRGLLREVGAAIGEECLQEDVAVVLGPGVNLKRSPLCGRNFEYFSEDPFLAGEIAAAMIAGAQSVGVGTSLKHFAVNNQEYRRMSIDAVVDERTLRELYLPAFERAVKAASPWTVMCSYNRLGGEYCSQNERLLTGILREEWGFEGLVVTDWGACSDRVAGLAAGQDLEMPSSGGENDALIVAAVREGRLDEAVLDRAAERVVDLVLKAVDSRRPGFRYDGDAHHELARRAAAESMVLLKNEGGLLPLRPASRVAVIGAFAKSPRYQGTGSSQMNPRVLDAAWDTISRIAPEATYSAGYRLGSDEPDEALIAEACAAARAAEAALVLVGLPHRDELEAEDRAHLRMPAAHVELIRRVAAANPRTAVLLSNGAPVEMPWLDSAPAVLECYLAGEAGGQAVADLVFGRACPSGKLAESFPAALEDLPSTRYFPQGPGTVEYREALYVGYRWFDSSGARPLFPFGHGLSYTSFSWSPLRLSAERIREGDPLRARLEVRNSGAVAGSEIVQLYVRDEESAAFRPEKELKGFAKVRLEPGESREVEIELDSRAFAYYDPSLPGWRVESGYFEIVAAASSADIRSGARVYVESALAAPASDGGLRASAPVYYEPGKRGPAGALEVGDAAFAALLGRTPPPNAPGGRSVDKDTPIGEIRGSLFGSLLYKVFLAYSLREMDDGEETGRRFGAAMAENMPLRAIVTMGGGLADWAMLDGLLEILNGRALRGLGRLLKAANARRRRGRRH